jgi:hypothetical protein
MATLVVPVGARAPYGFRVLLSRATGDLDPIDYTTITACALEVRGIDGDLAAIWTTTLSAQTETTATATRICSVDGKDFVDERLLQVRPVLTIPGGERACEAFTIQPTR